MAAVPVSCLLALLPIEEGVAEAETLYLEGPRITVTGTGKIDLAGNQLDLRLTPHLHEPGVVSVAATVDIAGPINAPALRPVKRSLAVSAIRGLFRNAFGTPIRPGRALARRFGIGSTETDDPCDVALVRRKEQREAAELGGEAASSVAASDD